MVARWMPDAKIIFSVRNPVPRTWSHVRKDFKTLYGKPIDEASEEDIIKMLELPAVRDRSSYVKIFNNWSRHYPREQMLCIAYEQIVSDPEGLLRTVQDFVGAEHFIPPNLKRRVNARPERDMPPRIRQYLEEKFLPQQAELERLTGLQLDWRK